jgi:hypothetical protein
MCSRKVNSMDVSYVSTKLLKKNKRSPCILLSFLFCGDGVFSIIVFVYEMSIGTL